MKKEFFFQQWLKVLKWQAIRCVTPFFSGQNLLRKRMIWFNDWCLLIIDPWISTQVMWSNINIHKYVTTLSAYIYNNGSIKSSQVFNVFVQVLYRFIVRMNSTVRDISFIYYLLIRSSIDRKRESINNLNSIRLFIKKI